MSRFDDETKARLHRTIPGDRRGMTLVELTVVAVLGTLVLGSIFQVLVTNQRTYAAQNASVQDQQSLRAGMDVLYGELREISPADGDLVEMADHYVRVRSGRSLGLLCSVIQLGVNTIVQARVVGRNLRGDSARVFYENDPSLTSDDVWRTADVAIRDTTGLLSCPDGRPAQEVRLNNVNFGPPPDSITPGAPIRNFNHFWYGLRSYDGEPYLIRVDENGEAAPLVGPLRATDGVEFRYLDASGNATTVATNVRQIEVILRTRADYIDTGGAALQDSLKVRVFTRNTV